MSKKKHSVLGMAALAAAGAGAAVLANKSREEKQITEEHVDPNYRNTERGKKNEKNSKGIYYTNGNYEAFARPEKPEGVDDKHAISGRKRTCFSGSSLFPGKRRTDAGRPHSHSGSNGHCRRCM